MLTKEQNAVAVALMRVYLDAPPGTNGKTPAQDQAERDQKRVALIDATLLPLLQSFLAGKVKLDAFKSQVDGINKKNELWGFSGIKGQMFFNMVCNTADDPTELEHELQAAIAVPSAEEIASSRIKTFAAYVKRLGEQLAEAGESPRRAAKVSSVPFFLSYFWQLQNRQLWPVYYTASVNGLSDTNLWRPSGDLARDYVEFKHLQEELVQLFTKAGGKVFDLYEVEHVLWVRGGSTIYGDKPVSPGKVADPSPSVQQIAAEALEIPLIESYVPPIVAIIPKLARGDAEMGMHAKATGISAERALEKSVNAAFTVLGYETRLLGQGQGRVPDGIAIDNDNSYAIIWDAKARSDCYSIGTDDRTIRDYIDTQSRDLKRRRNLRNIYYVIVSSRFAEDYDEAIRTLKMDTHISELVLLEADALPALVDKKLRAPNEMPLGPDGIQRLFTQSGVVTAQIVEAILGE